MYVITIYNIHTKGLFSQGRPSPSLSYITILQQLSYIYYSPGSFFPPSGFGLLVLLSTRSSVLLGGCWSHPALGGFLRLLVCRCQENPLWEKNLFFGRFVSGKPIVVGKNLSSLRFLSGLVAIIRYLFSTDLREISAFLFGCC